MGKQALISSVRATSLKFDINVEAEREIDRVAAIGLTARANPLGALLIHAEAQDAGSCRHAALLVARLIIKRHRIARGAAEKIALAALFENMNQACAACGGRGFHMVESSVTVCTVCNGSKLHRYSDAERSSLCGLNKYPRAAYELALGSIRDALARTVANAGARLR
jgi:hypothetical protein